MHSHVMSCPPVGHKAFEKSLQEITLGDVQKPGQVTKFIRARNVIKDPLNVVYTEGELQKLDLQAALQMFDYPQFLSTTFARFFDRFSTSECRVYQFQAMTAASGPFVFGMFITDEQHNLIDYCVASDHTSKRRAVLRKLIRAICTPESVAIKFSH